MKKINIDHMVELYHKYNGNHFKVARELGCSREYVRQVLTPKGLKAQGVHPRFNDDDLRKLYQEAKGIYSDMARIAGVSKSAMTTAIRRSSIRSDIPSKALTGRPPKKQLLSA